MTFELLKSVSHELRFLGSLSIEGIACGLSQSRRVALSAQSVSKMWRFQSVSVELMVFEAVMVDLMVLGVSQCQT